MNVKEVYQVLNEAYSPALSCDWDNDGLQVLADPERAIRRALVALDPSEATVARAIEGGYDLIVTHHPLIFHPLNALDGTTPVSRSVAECIRQGISVMTFHTRLDAVQGGVNDALVAAIGLTEVESLPEIGRIGRLPEPMSLHEFAVFVKKSLGCETVDYVGDRQVSRVAVVGGDGKDHYPDALAVGADTYLTGAMNYNTMVDAAYSGMNVVQAGHFFTEQPVCKVLAAALGRLGISADIFNSNPIRVCGEKIDHGCLHQSVNVI